MMLFIRADENIYTLDYLLWQSTTGQQNRRLGLLSQDRLISIGEAVDVDSDAIEDEEEWIGLGDD
jgi:hypothetical protein